MKEKLEKLKSFRNNLNPLNAQELTNLVDSIKNELPDNFRTKLTILSFYEYYEDQNIDNDLPF
jgi:hypothetical protein